LPVGVSTTVKRKPVNYTLGLVFKIDSFDLSLGLSLNLNERAHGMRRHAPLSKTQYV